MQYRIILLVEEEELATDIFFKSEHFGEQWLKHHYYIVSQLVYLLRGTRNFEVKIRRVR